MLKEQTVKTSGLRVAVAEDVDLEHLLLQLEVPDLLEVDHMLEREMDLLQMVLQQQEQVFNILEVVVEEVEKITLQDIVLAQMVLRDLLLSLTVAPKIK